MFEFDIVLDDSDYFEFNEFVTLNSPHGKSQLRNYRLSIPLLSSIVVLLLALSGISRREPDAAAPLVLAVYLSVFTALWPIFSKRRYFYLMKKRFEKMKKSGKLPYDRESKIIFGDLSFNDSTPTSKSVYKYSGIERIAESENSIYLFLGAIQGIIIPKRVFIDTAEQDRFIEFIKSRIS